MSDTNSLAASQETTTRHRRTQAQMAEAPISDSLLARIVEVTEQRIASRPNPMSLDTFEQIEAFAERAARSLMVPKDYQNKPDNIIIAVMKGKELGIPPIQSLESIAIVNGRCSLWGAMVQALCYASGLVEDHEEHFEGEEGTDAFTAVCTVKRKGIASPKVGRFSQGDAKRAGLFGQATHGKYPRRMMQWRAKHPPFTDAFPDVLRGIATREIEAEDAVATPGWTMPVPDKGWFTSKPQAQSDGWDNTWFSGVAQKLAGEPNAWKWLDLLVSCLADAPTIRDVEEIGDLPVVVKVIEAAPDEGRQAIDAGFTAARARLKKPDKKTAKAAKSDAVADTVEGDKLSTFNEWLVDGEGEALPDEDGVIEAFADPVAFARAYMAAKYTMFPADVEMFVKANKEACAAAQIASTEVARILAGPKQAAPAAPDGDKSLFGAALPVDHSFVPGPMKPAAAEFKSYNERMKAVLAEAEDTAAVLRIKDVNAPVYNQFPPKPRLALLELFELREKELAPAPARGAPGPTPRDIANGLLADIETLETPADVYTWRGMGAVMAAFDKLKMADQELYRSIVSALDAHRDALVAKLEPPEPGVEQLAGEIKAGVLACKTLSEYTAFSLSEDNIRKGKTIETTDAALWASVVSVAKAHGNALKKSA